MGSTIFFNLEKNIFRDLTLEPIKNIVSKLGEVMGLMNLKNAKESTSQNLLSSRHANFFKH